MLLMTGVGEGIIGARGLQILQIYNANSFMGGGNSPPQLTPFAGAKTSGVLRTPKGDFELMSGWDGPAGMNPPKGAPGFNIVTRTHVEGHAAALFKQQALSEGTVYINNTKIYPSYLKL